MKNMMCADFVKGMGVGMALGAALGMMLMPKKRKMSGMMTRVLRSAEDVVDVLSDALGF